MKPLIKLVKISTVEIEKDLATTINNGPSSEDQQHQGPDHLQVHWKHKSIGNQASVWSTL